MPDAVTRRLARTALVLGVLGVPLFAGSPADAAGTYSLSPTFGPPGTVVTVSGNGCAPGLLLSSILDYVQVTVTTVPTTNAHITVAANGSWHGTFTVPANAAAAPALVSPLCVSDGLQSLLTLYTPRTFTVTALASGTTTTPPSTSPPTTTAPSGPVATPTTSPRHPTTPTTTRVPSTTTPGRTTPSTDASPTTTLPGATPGANHDAGPASGSSPGATTTADAHAKTAARRGVYAADLDAPDAVGVKPPGGSGGLGWLLWLLLAGALLLLLAPIGWRWLHAPDEAGEPDDA